MVYSKNWNPRPWTAKQVFILLYASLAFYLCKMLFMQEKKKKELFFVQKDGILKNFKKNYFISFYKTLGLSCFLTLFDCLEIA